MNEFSDTVQNYTDVIFKGMDWEAFEPYKLLQTFVELPAFPLLSIAHYFATAASIRTSDNNSRRFAATHPIASIVGFTLICVGSGLMLNLFLGQPIKFIEQDQDLLLILTAWYLVFLSPFDIIYKICKFKPVKIIITVGKELRRAHKVFEGVQSIKSDSFTARLIAGVLNGAGSTIVSHVEQFLRKVAVQSGFWNVELSTKMAFYGSLLLTVVSKGWITSASTYGYISNVSLKDANYIIHAAFALIGAFSVLFGKRIDQFVSFFEAPTMFVVADLPQLTSPHLHIISESVIVSTTVPDVLEAKTPASHSNAQANKTPKNSPNQKKQKKE